MTEISNYDHFDYDYAEYWNDRKYENEAEKHLLSKIFSKYKGKWFLDIGGSYGRLISTYYNRYTNPIVLDYSLKTLQKNYPIIQSKYPNTVFIAANAYKMPFRDDSFDGSLMVRVLHHIEKPQTYYKELTRILHSRSIYVQEFANKVHIKARLRSLLKGDFSIFSKEPYQQPTSQNFEGTKSGEEALFLNFHPKHIKEMLQEEKMKIKKKYGCSYLRSQQLKKILGEETMISTEKILQKLFGWSNIPPSIVYENNVEDGKGKREFETLEDILACPICHERLVFTTETAHCKKCDKTYQKKENIWDFRED